MQTLAPDQVLQKVYGPEDLGMLSNFQGGYINFGYWESILLKDNKKISVEERIKSSEALYDLIFNLCQFEKDDDVLEIGCGRGLGCAAVATKYQPNKIVGIDITAEQIERANKLHKEILRLSPSLSFVVCACENLKFPKDYFNKIFSVEAAQHFLSIDDFASEAERVLKPNGQLVFATHFSTSQHGLEQMQKQDLIVKEGIDRLVPIQSVLTSLKKAGFANIESHTIGENVFEGYEKWISQIDCKTPWSHNIYKSYTKGYLDYYVILAS